MEQQLTSHELFTHHCACFILPTYNNAASLENIVKRCLNITSNIILVNDGSTDNTLQLLAPYPIQLVSYTKNKGKGYALRKGFQMALQSGYRYAITIDTDGQHYPEDAVLFLEKIPDEEDILLIGARNMQQTNVPAKSSFGNRFSNFWFWVETGIKLPDTQSGYRLYPIHRYKDRRFFTRKYEFEIEIIVRSAWMGIRIEALPVRVYYPNIDERISHFRPFKDFARISVLNTFLVLIAFLYIKPRDWIVKPIRQKGLKKGLWELLFNPKETLHTRAASVGFGVFMGIVPIWGFQLLVGIPLAIAMRLNKTLFILAANISIFPPIIWAASLAVGKWLFGNKQWWIPFNELTLESVKQMGKEFFVGGSVLAVMSGFLFYLLTFTLLRLRKHRDQEA